MERAWDLVKIPACENSNPQFTNLENFTKNNTVSNYITKL